MTLMELAEALGYPASHNSYLSSIEMGRITPKADFMLSVANLFGVSMDILTRDDQDLPGL